MSVQKLESVDGFVVTDLPDAPATGVVRVGRKILQSSARDLARTATFTFATFGIQRGGASAGINAEGDGVATAIEAFVDELTPVVAGGELHLDPAKGVPPGGLDPLLDAAVRNAAAGAPSVAAAGIVAATRCAVGELGGKTVAFEGGTSLPSTAAAADRLADAGATIVAVDGADEKPWLVWEAEVDALLVGSKLGVLGHQAAEMVKAGAIVPWGPTPVTTKAFALLRRNGITVVPDFVSAAGATLAGYLDGDLDSVEAQVATMVRDVLVEVGDHPDGMLLGACYRAEAFLSTWVEQLPFGRPLAA